MGYHGKTQSLTKKQKIKKGINLTLDIISIIIALFAVILIVNTLISNKKGYTTFFGNAYYTVASGSMDADRPDSFKKDDLIKVKILTNSQKADLKVGDVITFWDTLGGKKFLNTHRIIEIDTTDGTRFRTKGDANNVPDSTLRTLEDVQGKYVGKAPGAGKALLWMQTKTGFLVTVIVPSVLIVIYCLVLVIINALQYNKKKLILAKEEVKDELNEELRKQLREEILKEMTDDKQNSDENKE